MVTNLIGRLPGYPGEVWYNPDGIVNILSLTDAVKYFRVRYDSRQEQAFIVEKPDGTERRFIKTESGLYSLDMAASVGQRQTSPSEQGMALVVTVEDNRSKYPIHDYRKAMLAHKLQKLIGYPSTCDFLKIIDQNLIPNCPVVRSDILATEDILGPTVESLKGKTVRQGEQHIMSDIFPVPRDILSLYCKVTLFIDIMYMNKIPFLVTISCKLKFRTIEMLANRREDTVGKCVTNVMHLYGSRGFLVTMTHADGEFEAICGSLAATGSGLNVCSNDEHVPEIERFIRTVKDQVHCMYNSIPFR